MPESDARATPAEAAGAGGREKQDPARRVPAPQSQKKERETREPTGGAIEEADIPGGNEAPLTPPGADRPATAPPQGANT